MKIFLQILAKFRKLSYLCIVIKEAEFTPVRSKNFSNVH